MSITKIFGESSKIDLINHQQTTLFGNWLRKRSCRSLINVAAPETLMSILMDGHLQLSDAHHGWSTKDLTHTVEDSSLSLVFPRLGNHPRLVPRARL